MSMTYLAVADISVFWGALVCSLVGLALVFRAGRIACLIARRVHDAPFVLGSWFLVRPRPRTEEETYRYLRGIYRLAGVTFSVLATLLFVAFFYNLNR